MSYGLHFFSIILEETLQRNKLQIPKKIVRKCGGTLRDQVFLKLPCGSQWKLGLKKPCDGKVWIDRGWPEFSKHYSLARGHLLVFRYEGNSQFHVVIFDTTTTEIHYPNSNLNPFEKHVGIDKQVKEEANDGDDTGVQILDSPLSSLCPKTRGKSPLLSPRPHKRMRTSPTNGKTQNHDLRPKVNSDFHKQKEGTSREKSIQTWTWRLSAQEKAQALKRASGFKSKHPFFMLVMQPSHVENSYVLCLPYRFAEKHLSRSMDVILKAPDGRTWSVKYYYTEYDDRAPRAKFGPGWKAFVLGNALKLGDICVFVLSKNTGPVKFKVSIYRENGIADSASITTAQAKARGSLSSKVKSKRNIMNKKTVILSPSSTLHERKALALKRASHFRSKHPFFTVVLQPSYTTSRKHFRLPSKFARTYISNNQTSSISLCVSDGTSWSVEYRARPRRDGSTIAQFCRGWSSFAQDNGLEEGDICTFELINIEDDISFKVSIVKVGHEAYDQNLLLARDHKAAKPVELKRNVVANYESGGAGYNDTTLVSKKPIIAGKFSRASEAASKFVSTNPYFQVDFPSNRREKCTLHVPLSFAKSYFEEKSQTLTLQLGERFWPVTLLAHLSHYRLSRGWAMFVTENSLSLGDICIFELIKAKPVVLKVFIFRETC